MYAVIEQVVTRTFTSRDEMKRYLKESKGKLLHVETENGKKCVHCHCYYPFSNFRWVKASKRYSNYCICCSDKANIRSKRKRAREKSVRLESAKSEK